MIFRTSTEAYDRAQELANKSRHYYEVFYWRGVYHVNRTTKARWKSNLVRGCTIVPHKKSHT